MCIRDSVKALAPQHPEWKDTQPFKAVLEGDLKTALSGGEKSMMDLMMATPVSYTHLRAHETVLDLVCRLLLEKKKNNIEYGLSLIKKKTRSSSSILNTYQLTQDGKPI